MAEPEAQNTLDLSNKGLKKIPKAQTQDSQRVTELILDRNELQKWDNIDSYHAVTRLSASYNQFLRMYSVGRLHHLCWLDLSHNGILTIEGLKDLLHLRWLCLASNNIKTIEHLNTNSNLEYLDLSDNNIVHIADLSYLPRLKQLLLYGNRITQLRPCERNLPTSLTVLSVADNQIADLNEVAYLSHLKNLQELSIVGNPCVAMTGGSVGFDYRPFVINWCMSLKIIDGFVVDAIESLKAEWLYSQGRGRQFHVGDHEALTQYLASVCPLTGDNLESEEDRKLRLILSKAHQHQQQLRSQLTNGSGLRRNTPSFHRSQSSPSPSPAARRRIFPQRTTALRSNTSRLPVTERHHSPDRMVVSCQMTKPEVNSGMTVSMSGNLMTRSLDPSLLLNSNSSNNNNNKDSVDTALAVEDSSAGGVDAEANSGCPLQAATKLVPVPESLMSPDYRPVTAAILGRPNRVRPSGGKGSPERCQSAHSSPRPRPRRGGSGGGRHGSPRRIRVSNSSDDDSEMSASKLETIRHRAQERWQRKDAVPPVDLSAPGPTSECDQWKNTNGVQSNTEPSQRMPVDSRQEKAATCIQRMWRGYQTRNLNKSVQAIYRTLHDSRTHQYIQKLSSDMQATRAALESERKLQLLQMQAINALWKKVVNLQPSPKNEPSGSSKGADAETMKELTETCSRLHSQVEQLQGSMQSMMQRLSLLCASQQPRRAPSADTAGTQTDIVAVHTPQSDSVPGFPYGRPHRPSSLPISRPSQSPRDRDQQQSVQQFANSLVDGVLRTVAEQGSDTAAGSCASLPEDEVAPTLPECLPPENNVFASEELENLVECTGTDNSVEIAQNEKAEVPVESGCSAPEQGEALLVASQLSNPTHESIGTICVKANTEAAPIVQNGPIA